MNMLNNLQLNTLQSAVERIIPADDYPSGWDAGAGTYLRLLLTREEQFAPVYQQGLDALEAEARASAGQAFSQLTAEAQDALLTRVSADPAHFFHLLVEQTMEGFYANPGNGGNQDGIGWEMIGYRVTA